MVAECLYHIRIDSRKKSANDKQHQTEINLNEQSIENRTLSSTPYFISYSDCTVISIILGIAVLVVFYVFICVLSIFEVLRRALFLFTKLPVILNLFNGKKCFGFDSIFFATDLANSYCNF